MSRTAFVVLLAPVPWCIENESHPWDLPPEEVFSRLAL